MVARGIPFQVAVFTEPICRVGLFRPVEWQTVDAIKSIIGESECSAIVIAHRRIARVDKTPKIIPGQLREPPPRRIAFCPPLVEVAIANQSAVVVRSTHHDLWASPTRLPSPKIRPMESIHPWLHMVSLITGMVKTTIRSHPQIHGTIRSGEKFHIVDICVGIAVCREFASPCDPVAIQIPIHSAIFRAPDANTCRKLTVCIGGADVQREVIIILASIACSIF